MKYIYILVVAWCGIWQLHTYQQEKVQEKVQAQKVRSESSTHVQSCVSKPFKYTYTSLFRAALKKAYDELPKNNSKLSTDTFLKLMLKYKPLMRELH